MTPLDPVQALKISRWSLGSRAVLVEMSADGQLIPQPLPLANNISVQIGGATAQVDYAGLVEAGLYQLNVHVPKVPSGDESVSIKIGKYTSLGPLYISVQ